MRFSTLSILAIVAYCTATPITPQELSSRQALERLEAGNVPRSVANSFYDSPQEREVSDISTQGDGESETQLSTRQNNHHAFTLPGPGKDISFSLGKLSVVIAVDSAKVVGMTIRNLGIAAIKWALEDLSARDGMSGTIRAGTSELLDVKASPGASMNFALN